MELGTENDVGVGNDALILQKNGGYVGIGTINPTKTLDVNGTVNISQQLTTTNGVSVGGVLSVTQNALINGYLTTNSMTLSNSNKFLTAGIYAISHNNIFFAGGGLNFTFNLPDISTYGGYYSMTITARCYDNGRSNITWGTLLANCYFYNSGTGGSNNPTLYTGSNNHIEMTGYYDVAGGVTRWFQGFTI